MYSVVMKGGMEGRFLAVNVCHHNMLHAATVGKALHLYVIGSACCSQSVHASIPDKE